MSAPPEHPRGRFRPRRRPGGRWRRAHPPAGSSPTRSGRRISERPANLSVGSAAEWLRGVVRRRRGQRLYRDDGVRLTEDEIVIPRYFWPFGRKRIPYATIERVTPRPLKPWHGQFEVHGIDLWGRWYSHGRTRGDKDIAIDLHVGGVIRPVLTPEDPDLVLEILQRRVATARGGDTP